MARHPDATIPAEFRQAWRSGQHVGLKAPALVVEIQLGRFDHGYVRWPGDPVEAIIYGETKSRPWMGSWKAQSPWTELPGVRKYSDQQDFGQNGIKVGTVELANVGYVPAASPLGGLYHLIQQGYLSPLRGFRAPGRPASGDAPNGWRDVLQRKARMRVWQGYGAPQRNPDGSMPLDGGTNGAWTFNGLIDDIDLAAGPATVTVTARMAPTLTDQRLFGWAKSRTLLDPVTFMGRKAADDLKIKGGAAAASGSANEHPAKFVTDAKANTAWQSPDAGDDQVTHYVEVRLPAGRYSDFVVHPDFAGMDLYVGLHLKERRASNGKMVKPTSDGDDAETGWQGDRKVPGDNGGWQYLKVLRNHSHEQRVHELGHEYVTGDNTILRIGFRGLKRVGTGRYRAACARLGARRRNLDRSSDSETLKYVLVDDVSDMVRVVLRWAGYAEWDIEQTGVEPKGKFTVNRANFGMDVINKCCEQTGFVFYVDDPSDGESMGIPTFRSNSAVEAYDDIQEVRDSDLLTGIQCKITEEPLAYNIRVRGKEADEDDGGMTLGSAATRRIMSYYKPPWAVKGRLSGVLKHVTKTYPELTSEDDCLTAAKLIALQQALAAVTGTVQIPGNPYFRLDSQVGLIDTQTGLNTRMWITNRNSEQIMGKGAKWYTSIGGSMIDNPDLLDMLKEIG